MTALIFIFFLFSTPPTDDVICALWVSEKPGKVQMVQACGVEKFTNTDLVWRAVNIFTGEVVCERPATELPTIGCQLAPLDHYRLVVIWPDRERLLCTPISQKPEGPTAGELADQCPDLEGPYRLELARSFTAAPPEPRPEPCRMPPLGILQGSPQDLYTEYAGHVLAYQLRWHYGSGADPIFWQNQWNEDIFRSALAYGVPPATLKALFWVEAQYWPLYNGPEEVGMGQLTDDGADIVLRYSPALFLSSCSEAGVSCQAYALLSADHRQLARDVLRRSLITYGTPRQAAEQVRDQMDTWAQILAAYYCFTAETIYGWGDRPASLRWSLTLAAYHAGQECVTAGYICPAGQEYLRRIAQ